MVFFPCNIVVFLIYSLFVLFLFLVFSFIALLLSYFACCHTLLLLHSVPNLLSHLVVVVAPCLFLRLGVVAFYYCHALLLLHLACSHILLLSCLAYFCALMLLCLTCFRALLLSHLIVFMPCYSCVRALFDLTPYCSLVFAPCCPLVLTPCYSLVLVPCCFQFRALLLMLVAMLLLIGHCTLVLTIFKYLSPHCCFHALLLYLVSWYSLLIFLCRWRSLEQHQQASSNNKGFFLNNIFEFCFLCFVCLFCLSFFWS